MAWFLAEGASVEADGPPLLRPLYYTGLAADHRNARAPCRCGAGRRRLRSIGPAHRRRRLMPPPARTLTLTERRPRLCRLSLADVAFLLAHHRDHVEVAPTGRA